MTRVGLFGGAFDPVHNGHIALAQAVAEKFALEKLVFIPSKNPPHKELLKASGVDRMNMLKLALTNMESMFSVSDIELSSDGISYTFNTLAKWVNDNPNDEIFFISGSDIFATIESWYCWRELFDIARFIVVKREGFGFDKMFKNIKSDLSDMIEKGRLFLYDCPIMDVSSSSLRAKGSFDACFVPEPVLEYIKEHKLYEGSK